MLNKIIKAESSSDLRHHERYCDVDILGAVGLACRRNNLSVAIYRMKYHPHIEDFVEARRKFYQWTKRSLSRRKMSIGGINSLTDDIILFWLNDVCKGCNGSGFKLIKGTPNLSKDPCDSCVGTGKVAVSVVDERSEVFNEVVLLADAEIEAINRFVRIILK